MTTSSWLQYLQTQGASLDNGMAIHFGNPSGEHEAAATGSIVADLSHFALLEITGEDAQSFLQGQVTSDVRELSRGVAQYSSHCTAKGRMIASFLLWREGAVFRLMLPASLAAEIQKRLTMYVLRAKVRITNLSGQVVLLGIAGPLSEAALGDLFVPPEERMATRVTDRASLIRLDEARFLLACPVDEAPAVWAHLRSSLLPVGAGRWDWLDIRNGIPVILPQTKESFIPQMVNLDSLGGIGLNKGCYVGQEVVARAHYLGKVKRHMVLAHVEGQVTPSPGDPLCIQGGDGQAVGEVLAAQTAPVQGFDLLAVIKDESAEGRTLCLKDPAGPSVTLT